MNIRIFIRLKVRSVALAVLLAVPSAPLLAADKEFACKVVTIGGFTGITLVQAENKALAAEAAKGAMAFTIDNQTGTARSVVRCIDRREERFSDYQFQQFFESIGL
ncbi:MAG: hypothetical protein AAGF57_02910 [Pseudomonadota bacterium]